MAELGLQPRYRVRGSTLAQPPFVSAGRVNSCHYFPPWVTGLWLSLGILALLLSGACRRGVPVVDVGPKPSAARGTITGIVRGPEGTSAISGRNVEVINTVTGDRRSVVTGANGGFTIELPAGKYRLELSLRDGESVVKRPGIIDLDKGDIDSHIEFVLSTVRLARPRGPSYRLDNGLGSPIA
jgi:hypothetical protein